MSAIAPTDPRAWRVAIALGLESGLDWARWASKRYPDPDCDDCSGQGGRRDDDVMDQWYPCECLRDVLSTWDVDAYRSDCERRGVDPGPIPALEYGDLASNIPSGNTAWRVISVGANTVAVIHAGRVNVSVWSNGDHFISTTDDVAVPFVDIDIAHRLAGVADKAMAQP